MVLVDSSAWVRIEHRHISLRELVLDEEAATCPVVVLEVLRGTRNRAAYGATRAMLLEVPLLDDPTPLSRFEEAAQIYLRCRDAGVTPSAADCLVAACAIAHDVALVHNDADFVHIARVVPSLKLL